MTAPALLQTPAHGQAAPTVQALQAALDRVALFLPSQNPLGMFVHHNTLHAFEDLPFRLAVETAADLHGARAWCTMAFWHDAWAEGRILSRDLDDVIAREVADDALRLPGLTLPRRHAMRMLMLAPETGLHDPEASAWALHEHKYLDHLPAGLDRAAEERLRGAGPPSTVLRALWRACQALGPVAAATRTTQDHARPVRLAAMVRRHLGADLDALVEPQLVRWVSAFLDLGQADWAMPGRDRGFYRSALAVLDAAATRLHAGGVWLRHEAQRLVRDGVTPEACALESLADIGVAGTNLAAFVAGTLLALRGFGGMFVRLAERPEFAPAPPPPAELVDLLAVRLLLERAAVRFLLAGQGDRSEGQPLMRRLARFGVPTRDANASIRAVAPLFHVALCLGLLPEAIDNAGSAERHVLRTLVDGSQERRLRWLWQLAYERRYRVQVLDALVRHPRHGWALPAPPHTQVVCCIDDREESFRRHLEELDPGYETFGYAGFFGLTVRAVLPGTSRPRHHCPAGIAATHVLVEEPCEPAHHAPFGAERALEGMQSGADVFERGATIGLVRGSLAGLAGSLALLPMAWRLLFPEASAVAARRRHLRPETRLRLLQAEPPQTLDGLPIGLTTADMVQVAGRVLGEMGLGSLAPLVVVLGHGSASVNNPHAAGYNCGACAGGSGAINARAFAALCNRPDVRLGLAASGTVIPDSTWFVGGHHNTADDDIDLFDEGAVPAVHRAELERLHRDLDCARRNNAHERCRRFGLDGHAHGDAEVEHALRHAVGRTEDLAQARPEYNHATNALCVFGRRALTRGLFLDRRAFLVSYDPQAPQAAAHLASLVGAVGPVGAGINLEYFFSFVDNEAYGAGTKLPHNVVGLLGVLNGASSDLRTGLVQQMIEIHEPMRLLVVVEGTPQQALAAVHASAEVRALVEQRWVLVAVVDPDRDEAQFLHDRGFEAHAPETTQVPRTSSSRAWYAGHAGNLPPASIVPGRSGGLL
ncbi:MAG: DUF2309 family protein [Deltaproteobacteria bacterium]|nr:DUF2309 family protein [Deltaproteobacteria bacterium]